MSCPNWIKIVRFLFVLTTLLMTFSLPSSIAKGPLPEMDPDGYPAPNTGCLAPGKCHAGIEPIRAHNSEMAKQIYAMGNKLGDPNGCVVCHGGDGGGQGPVVLRGMPPPPSFMAARALEIGDGEMFHVLTRGQGNMASYAAQFSEADRWKVIRYVRQLQESP